MWVGAVGLSVWCGCEPSGSSSSAALARGQETHRADAGVLPRGEAPGAPGAAATWPPARKSLFGTAQSDASLVYFTGYRGALSEVFYPRLDAVQSVALEFLVGDADATFIDRESEQEYVAARPEARSMRWHVSTEQREHGWRLDKDIFTDPERSALIMRCALQATGDRALTGFRLYLRHDPALADTGGGDSAWTRRREGRTFLVAREGDYVSALATTLPWMHREGGGRRAPMLSSGFSGVSDGLTDLLGTTGDRQMDHAYASAHGGNVEQLGWLDLYERDAGRAQTRAFDVVLAFGASEAEALDTASAVLDDDREQLARRYDAGWQSYVEGLDTQGGSADDEYFLAAMTLQTLRDKQTGALVAGLGTPWGPTRGDTDNGGYHLVWARDLFKFANALVTAGDLETARGAVRYLFETLVQTEDCGASEQDAADCPEGYSRVGRFPQNAWLDGRAFWTSTQLDEQAMPILLALRVHETGDAAARAEIEGLWPRIRATADYIVSVGPWTPQERWEETSGYSPSTIAAEVAGLVAAAHFARLAGDDAAAARFLTVADYWQESIERWTFTTSGPYGDHRYYIRLNPARPRGGEGLGRFDPETGPDAATPLVIGNGGGTHDQREITDGGFLELVRLGVKAPQDPFIAESLAEYDERIRQDIPGKGSAWFRYDFDGYGETNQGGAWDGVNGRGRLWPIFTAERGMFEIARGGSGKNGAAFLPMLRAFATPEGFIPEQVYNVTLQRPGFDVLTPPPLEPGTPTDSIAPLGWAMGEYMSLLAAVHAGRLVDVPEVVCRRYDTCARPAPAGELSLTLDISAPAADGDRIYVVGEAAELGAWNPALGSPATRVDATRWRATIELPDSGVTRYALYQRHADGSGRWEILPEGERRSLTAPPANEELAVTARF